MRKINKNGSQVVASFVGIGGARLQEKLGLNNSGESVETAGH